MNSGETMSLPDFDAIAGRQTVAEFVNEYGRAEKDIRTGFALVKRGLEALGEGEVRSQNLCLWAGIANWKNITRHPT